MFGLTVIKTKELQRLRDVDNTFTTVIDVRDYAINSLSEELKKKTTLYEQLRSEHLSLLRKTKAAEKTAGRLTNKNNLK